MAELQVDQSSLPGVQEVSQYFSVLEDGALAHNLQEQENEQYYTNNVQRSQLVQKDIRVAKRLQDEEQQRAQMLHEQTSRHLEERDSEYARRIQDEIQRTAEEERRREERDMEIAKRIQEEEELYIRQNNSCRRTGSREIGSTIGSPNTLQPSRPVFSEEEELAWHSRERSPSPSTSDYEADYCESRRSFNRECADDVERRRQPWRERPLRRRSGHNRGSGASHSSTNGHLQGGWDEVVQLIKNDLIEQGYLSCTSEDEIFEPVYKLERILSRRQQASEQRTEQGSRLSRHSSMRVESGRMWQGDQVGRMERYRHSDYRGRGRPENRLVRSYSSSDSNSGVGKRRVRFQDDRDNFSNDANRAFVENREQRCCTVRPNQNYVQLNRRTSFGAVNQTNRQNNDGVRTSLSQQIREEVEDGGRFKERGSCRVRPENRPRAHSAREEWRWAGRESRQYYGEPIRRRVRSEPWRGNQEDRSSTEEEEVDWERERRREENRAPRHPQRSLSASYRGRSPGAGQRVNRPFLDLGELGQVLQDEELARRLQAEENIREDLVSASPSRRSYPKGDFTVAQVAQDEEIARYMQAQEIKTQLRPREVEDYESGQEYHEYDRNVYDNREVYDGQVLRERLDSEGLMSPVEEFSPEPQLPSPNTLAGHQHSIRNVAEDLDPTFHRNDIVQTDACQVQTTSQADEEPAFVAPTKRQNDKSVRAKSKEKKEASKSKETCKQQ